MTAQFQKAIGTYKCHRCNKRTRETGSNESAYELCKRQTSKSSSTSRHDADRFDTMRQAMRLLHVRMPVVSDRP
jgi:hypothetical protein